MRYSIEPMYRKYVRGYSFLSFARKFEYTYGKKLIKTAEIDAANTLFKRVVQE